MKCFEMSSVIILTAAKGRGVLCLRRTLPIFVHDGGTFVNNCKAMKQKLARNRNTTPSTTFSRPEKLGQHHTVFFSCLHFYIISHMARTPFTTTTPHDRTRRSLLPKEIPDTIDVKCQSRNLPMLLIFPKKFTSTPSTGTTGTTTAEAPNTTVPTLCPPWEERAAG